MKWVDFNSEAKLGFQALVDINKVVIFVYMSDHNSGTLDRSA